MPANLSVNRTSSDPIHQSPLLFLAIELSAASWKLAFSCAANQRPRLREVTAQHWDGLQQEIRLAKQRLKLPADAPVLSCYEAGRDGFSLHRFLTAHQVQNLVVDSSSIEVNRRQRRAKSDRLDVGKLLSMLIRYADGEEKVWSVINAPSPEEEDARQLHRELLSLKGESTQHVNRIKGLLASHGLSVTIDKHFPKRLSLLRMWNDQPAPRELQQRLLREFERLQVINRQIRELDRQRVKQLRTESSPAIEQTRQLLSLRGIGLNSAWLYAHEFFSWRKFQNGGQVGSLAGLTPTPHSSGTMNREQGISKAGNKRIRAMAIEIAWGWLRFQPQSTLSEWFTKRFGSGSSRQRRIGIVALARKLLVDLWKYLETGVAPAGAELDDWRVKAKCKVCSLTALPT
jgi:transposase